MSSDSTAATTERPSLPQPGKALASPDRIGPEEGDIASPWSRLEDILERIGDRLNPILVKEARQSMKSRQFIVTF
jgi:hypothetical protein